MAPPALTDDQLDVVYRYSALLPQRTVVPRFSVLLKRSAPPAVVGRVLNQRSAACTNRRCFLECR